MFHLSRKNDKEDSNKKMEEYKSRVNENINKNQDWLYPIMSAFALGGIEKTLSFAKEYPGYKLQFVVLAGCYALVLWLIIANFYFDSIIRNKIRLSDDPNKIYVEKLCIMKCVAFLITIAFWLLTISTLLTLVLYANII